MRRNHMYCTTAIHPKKEQRPFMQLYRMPEKQAHPINSGERKKKNLIFASWKIQC